MTKKRSNASGSRAKRSRRQRLTPERLSALEAERDTLLVSIADLKREHKAGDLDEEDFNTLKDHYTRRAAAVLRTIESHTPGTFSPKAKTARNSQSFQEQVAEPAPDRPLLRRLLPPVLVGAFAVVVGLFLAQTLGERGVDDLLTGSIDTSRRDQVIGCRRLGEDGDLIASLECYDDVLEVDPTNVDALTYRGWFRVLQVDAVSEAGETAVAQELLAAGERDLTLAIEVEPSAPDALAFRSVVHSRLGRSEAACEDIAALVALDPPQFYLSQTSEIAATNGC